MIQPHQQIAEKDPEGSGIEVSEKAQLATAQPLPDRSNTYNDINRVYTEEAGRTKSPEAVAPPQLLDSKLSPWLNAESIQVAAGQKAQLNSLATITSAGLLLALAGESAAAETPPVEAVAAPQAIALASRRSQPTTAGTLSLAPQVEAYSQRAAFSAGRQLGYEAGTPLIAPGNDGSWYLSYPNSGRQESSQAEVQTAGAAIAQIARQTCEASHCRQLARLDAQLQSAQQSAADLQEKITDFESRYGQGDIAVYQQLLSSRIAEITEQKTQLLGNTRQTQKQIAELEMQLAAIEADTQLAEQVLAEDAAYQSLWAQLQANEERLIVEFSRASLDGTADRPCRIHSAQSHPN